MSGRPFNNLSRRDFLAATIGGILLAACGGSSSSKSKTIPGELIASGSLLGHQLRDKKFPSPTRTEKIKVAIVGGGISGLSAARWLKLHNVSDYVILDLEKEMGGNAVSGKNEICSYPWAAHYLPVPSENMAELFAFLEEAKILTRYVDGKPEYEETYLCYEPQERLFINGVWQDDLVPEYGLPPEDRKQIAEFFRLVDMYREKIGSDGKRAFVIPLDQSSEDETIRALDKKSMAQLVKEKGWNSPYLLWYLNYCCNDDYGTSLENTSAWAGIHYFSSRRGVAANAPKGAVLTWPEGNAFLAKKLQGYSNDKMRTSQAVFAISTTDEGVQLSCYDGGKKESYTLQAERVICAVPHFARRRMLQAPDPEMIPGYSPWIVANISVTDWPQEQGQSLSWDNVIYASNSLGYVDATHQLLQTNERRAVLTFYYPLTDTDPTAARERLHTLGHEELTKMILAELEKVNPNVAASIDRIDVRVWGHAMVRPVPGYIWSASRQELMKPVNGKIFFAHSDLSGISIFEEAFYHGIRAAGELIASWS